jgi:putative hydrolase of the HAD superfamily
MQNNKLQKDNFSANQNQMKNIKTIAFDADDTLWVNEPHFQEMEAKFCEMMEDYLSHHHVSQELFKTEMSNLALYGFGVKSFMLSMIETALRISDHTINLEIIEKFIGLGKELLDKPIELLDGVMDILNALHGKYRLVIATKGDLLDQEKKLEKSKLGRHFHHIEIMSDKKESDYEKLLKHLDIEPESFLMVGNSIKSDILPVLNIGGFAIHVPYHTTWAHEQVDNVMDQNKFQKVDNISEVISLLK